MQGGSDYADDLLSCKVRSVRDTNVRCRESRRKSWSISELDVFHERPKELAICCLHTLRSTTEPLPMLVLRVTPY